MDRDGVYERYDGSGRIVAPGDHGTDRVSYRYNSAGQLETLTTASGDVVQYAYFNGMVGRIRTQLSDGRAQVRTHYEYDAQKRLSAPSVERQKVSVV